jgi:hypothetical protein
MHTTTVAKKVFILPFAKNGFGEQVRLCADVLTLQDQKIRTTAKLAARGPNVLTKTPRLAARNWRIAGGNC